MFSAEDASQKTHDAIENFKDSFNKFYEKAIESEQFLFTVEEVYKATEESCKNRLFHSTSGNIYLYFEQNKKSLTGLGKSFDKNISQSDKIEFIERLFIRYFKRLGFSISIRVNPIYPDFEVSRIIGCKVNIKLEW